MAYDKVVDSAQLNAALTATANAIREKAGNSDACPWDASTGFASLIAAIQAGGGGGNVEATSGTFTPSADITCTKASPYSISHGLSGEPDFFMLLATGSTLNKKYMLKSAQHIGKRLTGTYGMIAYGGTTYQNGTTVYTDYYQCSSNTVSAVSVSATEATIAYSSVDTVLASGKKYFWVAVRWEEVDS